MNPSPSDEPVRGAMAMGVSIGKGKRKVSNLQEKGEGATSIYLQKRKPHGERQYKWSDRPGTE